MNPHNYEPLKTVLDEAGKKRLGQIVRQMRGNQGQIAYAKKLGIAQSTLSNYENGLTTPQLDHIEILAKELGMTPEEFVAYLYGRNYDTLDQLPTHKLIDLLSDLTSVLQKRQGT